MIEESYALDKISEETWKSNCKRLLDKYNLIINQIQDYDL